MRTAPRAYGLRMSCFLAVIMLFFTAIGMASLGWIAHIAYEQYKVDQYRQFELQRMKIIYSQPIIMQQKGPDLAPEATPMPDKKMSADKLDCGPKG